MNSGEQVFTVHGVVATPAQKVTLADSGLKERQHLQEWVLTHPSVLGGGVMVVTSEFSSWESSGGQKVSDRLDVLGLDAEGRPRRIDSRLLGMTAYQRDAAEELVAA